jgi:hypothetical protein
MRERELTYDERATYGECPVCHAADGQPCDSGIGLHLGVTVSGLPPKEGAHLGRLQRAPFRVREVAIG